MQKINKHIEQVTSPKFNEYQPYFKCKFQIFREEKQKEKQQQFENLKKLVLKQGGKL